MCSAWIVGELSVSVTTNDANRWQQKCVVGEALRHSASTPSQHEKAWLVTASRFSIYVSTDTVCTKYVDVASYFSGNCALSFAFNNSPAVGVLTLFIIILFCSLVVTSLHLSNGIEIKYVTVIQRDHDYKWNETILIQAESNLLCIPAVEFPLVMAQL